MPGYRPQGALINLYLEDKAPWNFPRWQELTCIRHGLFPSDDSQLPAELSRAESNSLQAFFSRYSQKASAEDRVQFLTIQRSRNKKSPPASPGLILWNTFTNKLWKKARLYDVIVQALTDANANPVLIMAHDKGNKFPDAATYAPLAINKVGMAMFGPEAMDDGGHVQSIYRPAVMVFIMNVWETLKSKSTTARAKLPDLEKKVLAAIEALNSGELTTQKLKIAMVATRKYQIATELVGTREEREKGQQLRGEMTLLFDIDGAKTFMSPNQAKGLCKLTRENLLKLASQMDVEDLTRLYVTLFASEADPNCAVELVSVDPELQSCLDGVDLGVEEEISMSPQDLATDLGFSDGLPFLFNRIRHNSGFNPWDDPQLFEHASIFHDEEHTVPLKLHWHQLAGVRAVLRRVFEKEQRLTEPCTGVLIADEVGLGKTAMAIAIIAFLTHLVWLKSGDAQMPPIILRRPYLVGEAEIPTLPHLVVVPGTLLHQWEKEIKTFFLSKKVEILLYHSEKTSRAQFWGDSGPFKQSQHKMHQVIILAADTAVQADFVKLYYKKVETTPVLPWELPQQRPNTSPQNTLFNQRYLTITFDEAHRYRNIGVRYYASLRLRQQATIVLACTATPLQTAPKDVAFMARLIGVPYFSSLAYYDEEKNDLSTLRRTKIDPEDHAKAQRVIVTRLQKHFGGRILRRTVDSKNWEGKAVLDLPPLVIVEGLLSLTARETVIIQEHAERAKIEVASSNSPDQIFLTSKFYMEYRMAFIYAMIKSKSPLPNFANMEEWSKAPSTKIDALAKIAQHYLARDDAPHVFFEDGKLVVPNMPPLQPGQVITRLRRVCAYVEFIHFRPLIQQVLDIHGIKFLWMDGQVPIKQRGDMIQQFYNDDEKRLLVFSSVGAAGVNLAIADVIVQVDVSWSAQDMRQINGRVHRQPQRKSVHAIHLIAADTSDVIMFGMANGKKGMLETFVNRKSGEDLLDIMSGKVVDDAESGEEDTPPPPPPPPRRRSKKTVGQQSKKVVRVEIPDAPEKAAVLHSPRHGKRKRSKLEKDDCEEEGEPTEAAASIRREVKKRRGADSATAAGSPQLVAGLLSPSQPLPNFISVDSDIDMKFDGAIGSEGEGKPSGAHAFVDGTEGFSRESLSAASDGDVLPPSKNDLFTNKYDLFPTTNDDDTLSNECSRSMSDCSSKFIGPSPDEDMYNPSKTEHPLVLPDLLKSHGPLVDYWSPEQEDAELPSDKSPTSGKANQRPETLPRPSSARLELASHADHQKMTADETGTTTSSSSAVVETALVELPDKIPKSSLHMHRRHKQLIVAPRDQAVAKIILAEKEPPRSQLNHALLPGKPMPTTVLKPWPSLHEPVPKGPMSSILAGDFPSPAIQASGSSAFHDAISARASRVEIISRAPAPLPKPQGAAACSSSLMGRSSVPAIERGSFSTTDTNQGSKKTPVPSPSNSRPPINAISQAPRFKKAASGKLKKL